MTKFGVSFTRKDYLSNHPRGVRIRKAGVLPCFYLYKYILSISVFQFSVVFYLHLLHNAILYITDQKNNLANILY